MWVVLVPFMYRLVVYYKTEKPFRLRIVFVLLLWGLGVSLFHYSVVTSMESIIKAIIYDRQPFSNVWGTLITYITTSSISHFIDFLVIIGLLMLVHLYKSIENEKVTKLSLETELRKTQLSALRMQLNPHFLFNTLNTISAIIGQNEQGQRLVSSLGDLLRVMLRDEQQIIPLSKEVSYLKLYFDIEEIRFQDQLAVKINIQDEAWNWPLPNLILQPIVENSIKHGLAKTEGKVVICINAHVDDKLDMLVVEVEDNGTANKPSYFREGIGISNLRKRLRYHYNRTDLFEITFDKNRIGCSVTVKFPNK